MRLFSLVSRRFFEDSKNSMYFLRFFGFIFSKGKKMHFVHFGINFFFFLLIKIQLQFSFKIRNFCFFFLNYEILGVAKFVKVS